MAKRSVTARVEEKQLKRAGRYLKARSPAETMRAALDFVAEKAAHEQVVRKYRGAGWPEQRPLIRFPSVKQKKKLVEEGWGVFHVRPRELKEALESDLFDT